MKRSFPVILIPAYNPPATFTGLCRKILAALPEHPLVVVNDGSDSPESAEIFEQISELDDSVFCLLHPVNCGKGAALKTGIRYVLEHFSATGGIITADCDGQHLPEDIATLAHQLEEDPRSLLLGIRDFSLPDIPFRNRAGNRMTSLLFYGFLGRYPADTQCGLRAIPASFLPELLEIHGNRYEFETGMLIRFFKHHYPLQEIPVTTVYNAESTKVSGFKPLQDSCRILILILRAALSRKY